jgi:methylmalonyl-CoA mutase C-terminal domain/subunit
MVSRRGRILLGVLGEGRKEALLKLAKGLSEAGFEIIYTDLKEPRAIAAAAVQESADHIGLTVLDGAGCDEAIGLPALLKEAGGEGVGVSIGGFLSMEDALRLKAAGFMEVFPQGTTFDELVEWSRRMIVPQPAMN